MTQTKKAKKFIFIVLVLFVVTPLLYIVLYHLVGTKKIKISHSYRQFLLHYTQSPRFIIESGSNSIHSIDARTLEEQFNMPTIIISDAASYPLSSKLRRLERYATKQDIILLPLEFYYYSRKTTASVFGNNLLGLLNFYYNYDSAFDELKQIENTPLNKFAKGIKDKYRFYNKQAEYLSSHFTKFQNKQRGSSIEEKPFDKNIKATCDQYVLGEQLKNGFKLSKRFKKNIEIIKTLNQKGYKIFFTWPAVVGDDCFSKTNRTKLKFFVKDIKAYLKKNNLLIIGNPFKNKFSSKFISNTYYHVNFKAKKIRTKLLMQDIKQSSMYKYILKNTKTSYQKSIKASKDNMLKLLEKTYHKNEQIGFQDSSVIYQNWSKPEKSFRWSKGNNSKIFFKFNPKDIKGILHLHVKTLGTQKIVLSINENRISSKILYSKDTNIKFKFNPNILSTNNVISLYFPNAHKPDGRDNRVLAVALKSFVIE